MFNDSLSKREQAVMSAVFQLSQGKDRFLVSPQEIIAQLPPRLKCDEERLCHELKSLELDGYFELLESDRKGERVFVVQMKDAGLSFRRSDAVRKRKMYYKIAATVALALLSALIGVLVRSLLG